MNRLPAPSCMFCDTRIEEVGGQRIYSGSSLFNGMRLAKTKQIRPHATEKEQAIEIAEGQDGFRFMIIWGAMWTPAHVNQVRDSVLKGEQPWMCQRCANRVCSLCGAILAVPQGADIVNDDGHISHQMIVPSDRICSNPECERYMPRE